MKRFVLLAAVASLFISAAVSNAAPWRGRAYDGYYGWGYAEPWVSAYYGQYAYSYPYYYNYPYYGSYPSYSGYPYYSSAGPFYSNYPVYSSTEPFYTASTGPWASADWYKNVPMASRGTTDGAVQNGVVQAGYTTTTQPAATQWGLLIDEVVPGGAAKKADLHRGDVIIGVGTTRTQTFEELQKALSGSGSLEVVFLNAENRKMEKVRLTPVDGKIGVAVVPATLR